MYRHILDDAMRGNITHETALTLLNDSQTPENAFELFKAASSIRDEKLGQELWWSAGISAILPCSIFPRCNYCTFFAKNKFPIEDIVKAILEIERLGIKQVHLSGGSDIVKGYDNEIIAIVSAIRRVSNIDLEINLGPSISRQTIRILKELNVSSITSSLETFNKDIFQEAKPGDSLEKRKQLLEMAEEEGVLIRSMMLVGLGESNEDRIEHLFYMRGLKNLCNLNFSRFNPFSGIAYHNRPRCSPWELARTVAVARLMLPSAELGLAAGNNNDDIPLWYLAGGGNKILGAASSIKDGRSRPEALIIPLTENHIIVNNMSEKQRYIEGLGRKVVFDVKELERVKASGNK